MEDFLIICSVCRRIQVDKEHNFWLDKTENPEAYKSMMKDYQRKLTDGLCPEDVEKYRKVYNI